MVFAAAGFFGTAAVTALTVQSTLGVRSSRVLDGQQLRETLSCLDEDLPPDGIKIGMLATAENVDVVADFISVCRARSGKLPVVLDPVFRSSSGRVLLEAVGVERVIERLLPLVDWVTPNLEELAQLTAMPVNTPSEMERAVLKLQGRLPALAVVATGGHLASADDLVALSGGEMKWLRGAKIVSEATHGTGCAFASALLCGLAGGLDTGLDGFEAATDAKRFVAEAIRRAEPIGHGRGPMNLLWPLRERLRRLTVPSRDS